MRQGTLFFVEAFYLAGPKFVARMTKGQLFKRALAALEAKSKLKYCLHMHVEVLYTDARILYFVT